VRGLNVCRLVALVGVLSLFAKGVSAATVTWAGLGANGLWSSVDNWVSRVPPVAGDSVVFDGGAGVNPTNDLAAGTMISGITFSPTASGFTLGGNGVTLGGDVVDRSAEAQAVNFNLLLNGSRTVSVLAGGPTPAAGSVTINGVVSDGGGGFGLTLVNSGLNKLQTGAGGVLSMGSMTLTRANTYTGATVAQVGNLILDYAATGAPTANIVSNQSSLVLGNAGLPTTTPGVGQLMVNGGGGLNNSQTFNGTMLGIGANAVTLNQNGANNVNVALGAITRKTGGVVTFTLPSAGSISASAPVTNGIMGAWATVGDSTTTPAAGPSDWATIVGGNVVSLSTVANGYTDVTGTPTIVSNVASNVRWTASSGNATVAGPNTTDINTFLYSENTARVVNITGTLRFGAAGGILRPNPSGTTNLQFSGGRITAGGADNTPGELILNNGQQTTSNNNNGTLQINSVIADNGTGAVSLIKTGRGSLSINGANTFTGDTYILQGRISMANAAAFGPARRNL
jgi:autotransporter-associated beta strand protein